MIRKFFLSIIIVVTLLIIISPIIVFIFFFRDSGISRNVNDWAALGSYIGGIQTPIISALSVIVLGYLTFLVSKNSSKENKNLFLQQKRIEAYDELMKLLVPFHLTYQRGLQYLEKINSTKNNKQEIDLTNILYDADEFNNKTYFFSEFHYSLYNFNTRYSHLFDYDFESKDYLELIRLTLELKEQHTSFYSAILNSNTELLKPFNSIEELNRLLALFLNQIRNEIN